MNSEFKIQIPITRAYMNESGEMLFEGTASSTSMDAHETIFNESCQESFASDILNGMANGEPVELESEHNGDLEPMNILGPVISAEIIDGNKLKIVGRLDPDNPKSVYYFKKMTVADPITKRVKQYGLSINGNVVTAHFDYNAELKKNIRVFDRVVLKRVGIVRKPSNPDSWIEKMIRSVEWDNVETIDNSIDNNEIEIKERSELEMSKEQTELEAVAVDTDTEVAELEVARDEEVSDAVEPVAEVAAEVARDEEAPEPVEVVAEVAAEVVTEEIAAEPAADEVAEVVEAAEPVAEDLNRTSYWTSNRLVEAMESVLEAICTLEDLARYDAEDLNVGMTDSAIVTAKDCFGKLQSILGQHVNMPADTERAQEAHEDLSDEVSQVEAVEEVRAEVEAVAVDNTALTAEILGAVVGYLDAEFTEKLDRKFSELMDKVVAEKIGENNLENAKEKDELNRKLETMDKVNTELLTRLEKVENEPASRPANQLLDSITRNEAQSSQRDLNLARAKEEGNSQELILHRMFPTTYVGYGEYTVK